MAAVVADAADVAVVVAGAGRRTTGLHHGLSDRFRRSQGRRPSRSGVAAAAATNNPGSPMEKSLPNGERAVILDGDNVFLTGNGGLGRRRTIRS